MTTRPTTRGFGISSLVPHDIVGALASAAEEAGYAMFWVNDLPGASGIASLAVAAKAAPTIELGVGVLAVDRWDAQRVAGEIGATGIDPLRLTIGIGAGQLSAGARVAVSDVARGLANVKAHRVVVGSLGPKMTRLGGAHADGVLLNWVTPEAAATLAGAAIDGGRERSRAPWIATYTRVATDEAARSRLVAECQAYEGYPAYARHFQRFGVRAMDTSVIGDSAATRSWLAGFDGVVDHVVVRAISATETLDGYLAVLQAGAPGSGDAVAP